MFENFRKRVGISYARFHFRKKSDPLFHFTDAVSRSRRALVIFPEAGMDWESTQSVLKYVLRRFASGTMLLVIREDLVNTISFAPNIKTVTYAREEVNTWFLPRASLLRKLKTSTFDVVLDLNVVLALPSAFVCRETNAPLRVSFAKESGDDFYNFQVQTKGPGTSSGAYRTLMKCLDMF